MPQRISPKNSPLSRRSAIAIFSRAPSRGKAKTRLIPLLGPSGAARFHAALISDAMRKADSLPPHVSRYFFLAGNRLPGSFSLSDYTLERQRGRNLGDRLTWAFRELLRRHSGAVVFGTDSPLLPARVLSEAFRELRICDGVLGRCPDGGFYLIGLRRLSRGIFRGVRWGTSFAFRDTLLNLLRRGFCCSILETFEDVDRPEDVRRLARELVGSRAARRLAPSAWGFLEASFGLRAGSSTLGRFRAKQRR